jgi:cysteine synthase
MESIFTMSITSYFGIEKHVGNTPLIRLRRLSELTAAKFWARRSS